MGGSQKSKRVSWASDVNLCQVRLFLSEESPSQVGMGTQDHLQAKTPWSDQSGDAGTDDNLPPGFEGIQPANLWRVNLSQIHLVTWRWPPRFEVKSEWAVVAGEESTEVEAQNQREMRVLEAVYPRPSAIPPNPSAFECSEDPIANDQNTPVVPITPIEDEDATTLDNTTFTSVASNNHLASSHPYDLPHSSISSNGSTTTGILSTHVEPDVVSAAQAALTSILSNGDQHNLIDRELLTKILSNPKMVEQLLTNHATYSSLQNMPSSGMPNTSSSKFQCLPVIGGPGTTSSTQVMPSSHSSNLPSFNLQNVPAVGVHNTPSTSPQYTPTPNLSSPPKFDSVNFAINRREPLSTHLSRTEINVPSTVTPSIPFYPPIRNVRPSVPDVMSASSQGVPLVKDVNYYKSLIQQHGEERRESLPQFANQSNQPLGTNQEPMHVAKLKDSKQKIMKPCIFFNSSRGCRNGANCAYQHDVSSQQRIGAVPEVQSTKRVKIDREITGT